MVPQRRRPGQADEHNCFRSPGKDEAIKKKQLTPAQPPGRAASIMVPLRRRPGRADEHNSLCSAGGRVRPTSIIVF